MYICDRCGSKFEEPKTKKELHGELTSPYGTPYEEYHVCPECGSEDFSLLFRCKLCGQDTKNTDYCSPCYELVSEKMEEMIDELSEYFVDCDDPRYEITECIEEVLQR